MEMTGSPAVFGETGYTPVERQGVRPTLDVNGMYAGFIGEGAKTIIPAYAKAKISCRLVPNQDPIEIFNLAKDFTSLYCTRYCPDKDIPAQCRTSLSCRRMPLVPKTSWRL